MATANAAVHGGHEQRRRVQQLQFLAAGTAAACHRLADHSDTDGAPHRTAFTAAVATRPAIRPSSSPSTA